MALIEDIHTQAENKIVIIPNFELYCIQNSLPIHLLTAHNWQKWKSTFLTCPCHKIYREEAVGPIIQKVPILKITIFVNM